MAKKTQGSQLFVLMPVVDSNGLPTAEREVMAVECMNNFNGGGNPADQIVIECLENTSREYMKGLRTPGQATFTIDADPNNDSHVSLYEASESDDPAYEDLLFALGWSDGNSAPTVSASGDDFELPSDRTFFIFAGYVGDFPFDFQANTTVKTNVSVQRSGRGFWVNRTEEVSSNGSS